MTTPRLGHDMALPHGGLLAFLRRPAPPSRAPDYESSPPPYDGGWLQSVHEHDKDDDESTIGFWGESEHKNTGTRSRRHLNMIRRAYHGISAFCCFWFAISIYILGAFGAFFVLDLAFTRLGMGTGMATWMVHRNVGRGMPNYEMHFCLATPNRQAPGPQTWRYVEGEDIANCKTDTLTMMASSTEVWKAFSDDNVIIGADLPLKSGYEITDRFMSVADKVRLEELGDDLAEEGSHIRPMRYVL